MAAQNIFFEGLSSLLLGRAVENASMTVFGKKAVGVVG